MLHLLNQLAVQAEVTSGYDRDLFRHWIITDGCTTREWVLIRQALSGTRSGCLVVDGSWFSRYDGARTDTASSFDIDHLVPLAEAWGSGAADWSPDRRMAFANDQGFRPSLIAVSASSNRSKGDRDPAEWLPDVATETCRYLRQWVAVKFRWALSVDPIEKRSVASGLGACPLAIATPPLA